MLALEVSILKESVFALFKARSISLSNAVEVLPFGVTIIIASHKSKVLLYCR